MVPYAATMHCRLPRVLWPMLMTSVLLVGTTVVSGCTSTEGRTALAIERTGRGGNGTLVVYTECADIDEVAVTADHGGSPLREVTVWGRPKIGRCASRAEVSVAASETQIVDGATSMVLDLPGRAAP